MLLHTVRAERPDTRSKTPQGQQKRGKRGTKRKRGRELTIVVVVFHIITIVGESSQKLNKNGKTFSSVCGFYLVVISKNHIRF
jgi:hypothetical protein